MKKAVIPLALMLACEDTPDICNTDAEKYPVVDLYVDQACSDSEVTYVLSATRKLNRLARDSICQDIVSIVGYDVVDHSDFNLDGGKLACYYFAPDWYSDNYDGVKGNAVAYESVRLFLFLKSMRNRDARLSLIMHELMHFVGVHGHTDAPSDIMYTSDETKTEYTSGDAAHFCSVYDCEK